MDVLSKRWAGTSYEARNRGFDLLRLTVRWGGLYACQPEKFVYIYACSANPKLFVALQLVTCNGRGKPVGVLGAAYSSRRVEISKRGTVKDHGAGAGTSA